MGIGSRAGSVWKWLLLAIPLAIARTAAADNLSVFAPVSPPASSIRDLFILVIAITGAIFILYEAMLVYFIVRFRRGGRGAAGGPEPPQIYGSTPIEVAWTLAPLLIVFVIFLVVIRTVGQVRQDRPRGNGMRVTVVGHQWWWEYDYPDLGVRTANELHVPASDPAHPQPVDLELQAADVIHSFWVPRLAGKTDLIPGRINRMWFQAEEPGTFEGQCGEYCGAQHANMMIRVIADRPDAFRRWVEDQKKPAADQAAGAAGRRLFFAQACQNCHAVRGTPARGTVGPDLTHLMSRQTLASGMVPNTHDQLIAWVTDPQRIKPECLMPALRLSPRDVRRLVAYLETLH